MHSVLMQSGHTSLALANYGSELWTFGLLGRVVELEHGITDFWILWVSLVPHHVLPWHAFLL